MSAIRLLVLGAVRRRGRAHGYQVRTDLESWGAHEWSNALPGSIYHALKQLHKEGALRAHDTAPSTVGGPPRTEYEVSTDGEAVYFRLLRSALTSHDERIDLLTAAVGLIDDLSRDEAIGLLYERVEALDAWRETVTSASAGQDREWGLVGEVLGLWTHTAASDAEWTRGFISRLESGAYVMADEAPRS